jgi:F0F1-type ATP synthase membrane subunit b/b'
MAQQGKSQGQPDDKRHEKARDLGEDALGELAKGHEAKADQLIEQAKKLDKSALREIVEDLDEDAGSNPDAVKDTPG